MSAPIIILSLVNAAALFLICSLSCAKQWSNSAVTRDFHQRNHSLPAHSFHLIWRNNETKWTRTLLYFPHDSQSVFSWKLIWYFTLVLSLGIIPISHEQIYIYFLKAYNSSCTNLQAGHISNNPDVPIFQVALSQRFPILTLQASRLAYRVQIVATPKP